MGESVGTLERVDFGSVSVFMGDKNGKYPDGNQIVIRGTEVLAALDTPLVSNVIGAEFDSTELVVLGHVHEDHMAGLHRLPHAQVYAPAEDLPAIQSWEGFAAVMGAKDDETRAQALSYFQRKFFYAPRPDAQGYVDGATWELGGTKITAFHMPGHTAGHTVLLIEPEGIAFIGDIDLTGFGPYYGDEGSSLQAFRQTLRQLPGIPATTWVTSHHRGIYTQRSRFLEDLERFAAKFDERNDRLLAYLHEGPQSLNALVARRLLYPPGFVAPWVEMAEQRTITRHLDELMTEGRVTQTDAGDYAAA